MEQAATQGSVFQRYFHYSLVIVILAFFTLAPIKREAINQIAAVLAILGLSFGWRGLKLLSNDQKVLLAGFVVYVLLSGFSLINNEDFSTAAWRFERYHPFLLAVPLAGLLIPLRASLPTLLLVSASLAAVSMGGFAMYQSVWLGMERTGYGTGLNPNIVGHLASLDALVLLVAALYGGYGRWMRVVLLLMSLLAIYALFGTGSRGNMGAFVLALGSVIVMHSLHAPLKPKQRARALLVTLGIVVGLVIFMALSKYWVAHWERLVNETERFFAGDYQYSSITGRAVMWMGAGEIWLQHPWIGTGLGDGQADFNLLLNTHQLPPVSRASAHIFHNIFADALATTGLVGTLGMLLGVFILPFRYFRQHWRLARLNTSDVPLENAPAIDSPSPLAKDSTRRSVALANTTGPGLQATASTQSLLSLMGIAVLIDNFIFGLSNSWLYLRGLPFVLMLLLLLILGMPERQQQKS